MASYPLYFLVDGKVVESREVVGGTPITPPPAPLKEGYNFVAWEGLPALMPQGEVRAVACYEPDSYTLTMMTDGEVYATYHLQSGTDLTTLPLPEKEGYTFLGWSKNYRKMPRSNLTLKGSFRVQKFHIVFEIEGEMSFERVVEYGAPLRAVVAPQRDHYTFSGWGDVPATMPARDLHFKASFTLNAHPLTFVLDGQVYESRTVSYDEPVKAPDPGTREGYVFSGWRGCPKRMPDHEVTCEGRFYRKKYRLQFTVDGKKYAWASLPEGAEIELPEPPVREGETFLGWSDLPARMPRADVEVIAMFSAGKSGEVQS